MPKQFYPRVDAEVGRQLVGVPCLPVTMPVLARIDYLVCGQLDGLVIKRVGDVANAIAREAKHLELTQ
jgi:hypothetical protein